MDILEKVAYLKGLADGLKLDESTSEGKILKCMIDVLDDMAANLSDMEDGLVELSDQLDEVDEDLATLEDEFYGDYDEDEEETYEVECPQCGEIIVLDEDALLSGEMNCPSCGEKLEFDLDDIDDECDCGCDCEHCADKDKD